MLDPCLAGGASAASSNGCGTGYFAHLLETERGWRWCPWITVGTAFATRARLGLETRECRAIYEATICRRRFDLVMSVDVLAHLPRGEEQVAPRELARVWRRAVSWLFRTAALDILRSRHSIRPSSGSGSPGAGDGVDGRRGRAGVRAHTSIRCCAGGAGEIPGVGARCSVNRPPAGLNRWRPGSTSCCMRRWRSRRPGSVPVTVSAVQSLVLIGEKMV